MSHLAIFTLGPLRIELEGQPIQTSRHKALALLIYLARCQEKQSREALSALLWPDYEQGKAFAYLRRALWELHSLLGEGCLEASREEIWLNRQVDVYLDVAEFQSHLAALKQHNHPETTVCPDCLAHLNNAALLYRGDFLAGFSLRDSPVFEDWQIFQGEQLRQDYALALDRLANLLYLVDSFQEAGMFAQRWLALDTLNEEAHRLLMKLFERTGQRHLAIRQFQECQRVLQAELGVTPGPATRALYEAIISDEFASKPQMPTERIKIEKPAAGSGQTIQLLDEAVISKESVSANNLPTLETGFVGREKETGHISTLLSDPGCWLLTLLGPGGIGKTRLALEVGSRQSAQFPQGICFVSLSMVETERSIAPAIARALCLAFRQNGPPPEDQLFDFLSKKSLLLILDSFEQLVPWAGLLKKIHTHAPSVKLLVTSRQRLLLRGERVLEVKGLHYPRDQARVTTGSLQGAFRRYSALELFLQTARRSQETFQPSLQDTSAIIQIAQLLEGMPLGLELAATWLNTLTCQEIAAEISRSLDILETTLVNITERQRSMRAVFDHSWKLLSRREQTILPRLAVFRGSFSRQAAERIVGASLRDLSGLVDKSLVRRAANGRFELHDLLRQYNAGILERLPVDSQETHGRHCAFYCARLSEWNEQLSSLKQGQALSEIETDLENCQNAWDWAVSRGQFEWMEQAVEGLGMFYLRRARLREGWDTYRKANEAITGLALTEIDVQRACLSARLFTWQAVLNMNLERFEEAEQLLQEAWQILVRFQPDSPQAIPVRIFASVIQGLLANLQHDPSASLRSYRQAIEFSLLAKTKSPKFFIFAWRFLMGGSVSQELYLEIERNLEYVKQGGDPFELGCHLFTLGIAELYHAFRLERADPLLYASIHNFEQVGDPSTQMMMFKTLGYLLLAQGKFEDCHQLKQRELALVENIGDLRLIGITHAEIGEVLCHLGKYGKAEEEIRKGMALVKDRSAVEFALRHRYLGDVLLAQEKYLEAREAYKFSFRYFQSVGEKGWMFTALTGLSRAELALGEHSNAWLHAKQAVQLYNEIKLYTFFVYLTLAQIALLLADGGEYLKAMKLFNLAMQQGYLSQSCWFADLFRKAIEEAALHVTIEELDEVNRKNQAVDLANLLAALQFEL